MTKPTFIMLVGLPNSGKSTWAKEYIKEHPDTVHLAADVILRGLMGKLNLDFNRVFMKHSKLVSSIMEEGLLSLLLDGENIIYDRTNSFRRPRKRVLSWVPDHYQKIAVVFSTDLETLLKRREEDVVSKSKSVIKRMYVQQQEVLLDEGFDKVIEQEQNGNESKDSTR